MRRTKARGASKTEEKELLDRAKRLSENPELLLPHCAASKKCKTCPFDKIGIQLNKIKEIKDDQQKLKFQSKWSWNKLVRAYAGLLLLPHTEKNIYMIVAEYPAGRISYILNSRALREQMIGVQHFDNPKWRLLAYMDFAKLGFYLYSSREKLFCSGIAPEPPSQFIKEAISHTKYSFKLDDGNYRCPHILGKNDITHIRLDWHSAKISFFVCEDCASKDENLFCKLTEQILTKESRDDFSVDIKFGLKCKADCSECALKIVDLDPMLSERYLMGSLSDKDFIAEYSTEVQKHLQERSEKLFIAGEDCYGKNIDAFISLLNPTPEEKIALQTVLEKTETPVLLDSPTPSKVLSLYWQEYGLDAIESVVKDKKLAEKIFNKYSNEQPSQILKDAWLARKEKEVISALPEYDNLPPIALFADKLTRIYKTAGARECLQLIDKIDKKDMKMKSVAYGFLLALNLQEGKGWQYTKDEKDFATFLKEYAQALLDAKPDGYHDALQNLLTASGAGGEISKKIQY